MCDTQVYLARIYSGRERERCVGKELERARTERRLGGLAPGATAHLEASSPINCVIIAYIRSPRAGEANSGSEKTPLNTHSALQITITSSSTLFSHIIMVSFVNDSYIVRLLLILQTFKQPLGIQLLFVILSFQLMMINY